MLRRYLLKNLLEAILALMTSEVLQQKLVTHEQPPLADNCCKISYYHTQCSCLKERLAVPQQSLWTWLAGKPPSCWTLYHLLNSLRSLGVSSQYPQERSIQFLPCTDSIKALMMKKAPYKLPSGDFCDAAMKPVLA